VVGLGQGERAGRVESRHRRQPARALGLGPEHVDGSHREPRLDAEERPEASVAAMQLHVHEPARQLAHAGAAVALEVLADQAELGQANEQRPRQLGTFPVVVDDREHLVVDEAPGSHEVVRLLVAELLADEQVIGCERGCHQVAWT
jgi:hypothetical protein